MQLIKQLLASRHPGYEALSDSATDVELGVVRSCRSDNTAQESDTSPSHYLVLRILLDNGFVQHLSSADVSSLRLACKAMRYEAVASGKLCLPAPVYFSYVRHHLGLLTMLAGFPNACVTAAVESRSRF